MEFPKELKYTREHEWVRINEEDMTAVIGITDFAQSELGEIVYVEVETVGEEIDKDEEFGTIEAVKTTSELYMPLSGKVIEFNSAIDETDGDDPTLVNTDPYNEGWIIKIEISNRDEIEELMSAEDYEELVG